MPGRRILVVSLTAAALVAALGAVSQASVAHRSTQPRPNVLLVHGAFTDGSSWDRVTRRLLHDGYNVVASQIPLTSFADDVAAVRRDLRVLGGPTVVVGHSYGGAVITQAAQDAPNVTGLVFVAATAPDTGEAAAVFNQLAPPLPSQADFVPIDLPHVAPDGAPFVVIARDRFAADFCQDCSPDDARLVTAKEAPTDASAFGTPITGTPAWRQFTAWYAISTRDRIINPDAQRVMARRMDPTGERTVALPSSHASPVSHPEQVADLIERAAQSSSHALAARR